MFSISYITLSIVIAITIGTLFLGIIVFTNKPSNKANFWFFVFTLNLAIFLLTGHIQTFITDATISILNLRIDFVSGILTTYSFYLFTKTFSQENLKFPSLKENLHLLVVIISILLIAGSQLIVKPINPENPNEWLFESGPLDFAFIVFTLYLLVSGLIIMYQQTKIAEGYKKTQLKLLLFAACLPSSLVISFVVLGERFYSYGFTAQFNSLIFQLRTYADLSVSLFVLFTTYAMIKYRLFGVKVIISKLVYWIISSFMIFSLFYSVVLTELRYFDNLLAPQVVVLNVLLAIVITLFLQWFLQTLKRVINHLLTKYSYDPDAVYDSFVNEIGKTRTHSHVLETLFNTVSQTFAPNKQAAFIALTSDQNEQILTQWQNFTDNDIYHFEHEETINALLDYASRHDTFLIQQLIDAHSEENITKILSEMEIEVCIPFKSSALDGLLLIGKKHNRDGYTQEDLVLIEKLVYYASLNIERTL